MGIPAALGQLGRELLIPIYRPIRHRIIDRKIKSAAAGGELRLALGSAGVAQKGWIATDKEHLDLLQDKDWCRYFREGSVDAMVAEHVWEHLTEAEALVAAVNCRRYLKSFGYLRIAVPDGNHPDPGYIEAVKPMGSGAGADDHRVLYTHATLTGIFEEAGFQVELLEYFDASGTFHEKDWDAGACFIERSKRFDPRNRDGKLHYTSIILDAWKR